MADYGGKEDKEARSTRQRFAVAALMSLCVMAVAVLATKNALERPYNQINRGVKMGDKMIDKMGDKMRRDVVKPIMKAVDGKSGGKGRYNLAETSVKEAALKRMRQRELEQSMEHGGAIDEALELHEVGLQAKLRTKLTARKRPASDVKQDLASRPHKLEDDYHDHPWDLINREMMPLPNGGMESAAQMYARAGEGQVPVPTKNSDAHRLKADSIMSGGGTDDPRALMDLTEGLQAHEDQPQRVSESAPVWGEESPQLQLRIKTQRAQQEREQQQQQMKSEEQQQSQQRLSDAQARQQQQQHQAAPDAAKGGSHQGFVTGDHLRVTADEYHREMRYYMPSSDGRLVSPFEWFKEMGRPAPAPKQEAKQQQ